jgi:hypothetical protein
MSDISVLTEIIVLSGKTSRVPRSRRRTANQTYLVSSKAQSRRSSGLREVGFEVAESFAQRLNDRGGGFGPGEVLLAGDQIAIANREGAPKTRLDVIGADRFQFVLNAPRHDVLVAG